MKRVVYMDCHATTPVDPRVFERMVPYFCERFGNASSRNHAYGWEAEEAVENARAQVARLLGAKPREIVFTSGATESDNLAIQGVLGNASKTPHIVTVVTEHRAVLDTCRALEKAGRARVTYVPVDRQGVVDPDDVRRAIDRDTVLVSVMLANNEIGTIAPLAEIGRITRERGVLLHTDAAQAVGKIPVRVDSLGVDLLSLSAHKMYGPKGVGALYVRAGVRLRPLVYGGGHERGLRSGTLNVPGIVGLGAASELCAAEMQAEAERVSALRDRLFRRLLEALDDVFLNGHPTARLPGNLNVGFRYVEGESLLLALDDVAVSSGAACSSATLEPSHVLRAIGLDEELAQSSLRFGLGRFNTEEDVDYVAERVATEVRRLRALSPFYAAEQKRKAQARV
ncbi:MAG: cysteine desulfurase IscS [Candidatus Binatia bacterium]|nr:MAG: cysteine desulfurase IscS [Candidatus Binatia bacterium]